MKRSPVKDAIVKQDWRREAAFRTDWKGMTRSRESLDISSPLSFWREKTKEKETENSSHGNTTLYGPQQPRTGT